MNNPLALYVAFSHLNDLLAEAEDRRRAGAFLDHDAEPEFSEPSVPTWRRSLGGGVRRVGNAFAAAARTIDPSMESDSASHGRAFAG